MDINPYLSQRRALIDGSLLNFIPQGTKYTKALYKAVKYSLMSGGKRIRPILVLAACEAVSGNYKNALPLASAIEIIHTYTLIHDDLPAMDNDDLRRGKPTCHKMFGEDTAILAGDMLSILAFEVIARHYRDKAGDLILELSQALGIDGVVGGQLADLKSAKSGIDLKELDFISAHKTACLFIASVRCGAIVGGAKRKELVDLTDYATHIGLAFQIIDDILDHAAGTKNSYPAILGLDRSKHEADKHVRSAIKSLPSQKRYDLLRELALFLSERKL